ncbi:YceH family protein [Mesorhizobium sp. RCC_202]|uniref:YceH family protein n=1 Tax=Mesorhizobium sp. RCC_202 TaxID=3239222 RepID=UPI003526956F
MSDDLPILSVVEARVLGCLIEKKELTPDVYPLTLNAALAAANQKTAREPVMALEQTEVHRALKLLEQKGLVRQMFGSRVERYEHQMAQRFSLTTPQSAVLGLLLLRGPQTAHELLARAERMARFSSIEGLRGELDMLIGRRPPLVQEIPRGPGQREDRYVHLLAGPVDVAALSLPRSAPVVSGSDLEARVSALEEEVAALRAKIEALGA